MHPTAGHSRASGIPTGRTVTPVNLATAKAGQPIRVGKDPVQVLITPDGKTIYVARNNGKAVTPINTATNTAEPTIKVGGFVCDEQGRKSDPAEQRTGRDRVLALTPDP
jgi:YVTN family beta-propeller protein